MKFPSLSRTMMAMEHLPLRVLASYVITIFFIMHMRDKYFVQVWGLVRQKMCISNIEEKALWSVGVDIPLDPVPSSNLVYDH